LVFCKERMRPEWHAGGSKLRATHVSLCAVVLLTTVLVLLVVLTLVAPEALLFSLVYLVAVYMPVMVVACCFPVCKRGCCKGKGGRSSVGVGLELTRP